MSQVNCQEWHHTFFTNCLLLAVNYIHVHCKKCHILNPTCINLILAFFGQKLLFDVLEKEDDYIQIPMIIKKVGR